MSRFSPFAEALWTETAPPARGFPPLESDLRVDVGIVGAGYAGLSTALELADRGLRVGLVEAAEVGFGGSGRNAGHCTPTFHHHGIAGVRRLLGPARAERLIALQTTAADRIAGLVRRHQIRCEWVQAGYVMAAPVPGRMAALQALADSYNAVGQSTRVLDAAEVTRLTGMERVYGGWLHPAGAHLNPLAYARGLARAAYDAGVQIHEASPAGPPERREGLWQVATPKGRMRAEKMILATGAYTTAALPRLARSFALLRVLVAATAPMAPPAAEGDPRLLPADTTVHDGRRNICVWKRDAAGRLVVSMFPPGLGGIDRQATLAAIERRLRFHYPWLTAPLRWEYVWTGELDMQPRTIPRLWDLGPGALAVTGLSGRGVPTGAMLGQVLADWATGADPDTLPLPVEPLARSPALMAVAPRLMLEWYRLTDRLQALRQRVPSP